MLHHFNDPFPTVEHSSRSTDRNPKESIDLHAEDVQANRAGESSLDSKPNRNGNVVSGS